MTNEDLLSKTITYLRFPLAVGVTFIHFNLSDGLKINGIQHGLGNPDWFFFIVNFISEVLVRINVPLFFVISGFLFFYRTDFSETVYKHKLKSRAKTLLVPYLLWNSIAILWKLIFFLPVLSSFVRPVEIDLSFTRIINTFFFDTDNRGIFIGPVHAESSPEIYPINDPLWYVRDLMLMAICSPIIHWLIKRMGIWLVALLGTFWFLSSIIFPNGGYVYMLTVASFFFSWGAYFSISAKNIVFSFRKMKYIPMVYLIVALVDLLTIGREYNIFIHKIGILLGIASAVVVVSYLIEFEIVKTNKTLANSSFFIYVLHNLFIGLVGKFVFLMLHIPENNPLAMLALYFGVPLFSVAVCLILYILLKRYTPKVCNLLTGNR